MTRRSKNIVQKPSKAGPKLVTSNALLQRIGLVLTLLATVVAYSPAMNGGLLWDDDAHVTRPELQSFSGLVRIWTDPGATQQYYPLLHSTFWIEHKLWGNSVLGYHLVTLGWHLLAVTLLYSVLRKLQVPGALLATAIFALHPVMVESVAWISEQKNTLSAVFYLSAMRVYLEFDESRRRPYYALALSMFVLGLLTKTVIATLPAALLVIFWWKRGTINMKRDVLPLLPFFALGAVAGVVTAWVEYSLIGAQGSDYRLSFLQRSLLSGRVVWFYLSKLMWPANLIFIYPRWEVDSGVWWQWLFPLATLAVLFGFWAVRRTWRGPLAAWLLFLGTLVPVLGFLNVYPFVYSFVADHFQYLASIGMIVLVAAAIALGLRRLSLAERRYGVAACVLLIATLGTLTYQQSRMYVDSKQLYQSTIDRNPTCWMAYNNLGIVLIENSQSLPAIDALRESIRLHPTYFNAHNNLGLALTQIGDVLQGIAQYDEALRLKPDGFETHNNLGMALVATGKVPQGIEHFEEAIRLNPDCSDARNNLGLALVQLGQVSQGIEHYREAIRRNPRFFKAYSNLGVALMSLGNSERAIDEFRMALRLKPDSYEVYTNLGVAYERLGQTQPAIDSYQQAVRLDPSCIAAHANLGDLLVRAGKVPAALPHFEALARLQPSSADAQNNIGEALRQSGRPAEAIVYYQEALRLNPTLLQVYANLTQAFAVLGRQDEAVAIAEKGISVARANGQNEVAQGLGNWLQQYRSELRGKNETKANSELKP